MTVTPVFLPPDDSLSLHSLTTAVSSVKDIWRLLEWLDVPDSVWGKIRESGSYSSEEEEREAGLQYYLQTLQDASWRRIAGELWYMEEYTALETVKQYLPLTHGQYYRVCVYTRQLCSCMHINIIILRYTIMQCYSQWSWFPRISVRVTAVILSVSSIFLFACVSLRLSGGMLTCISCN